MTREELREGFLLDVPRQIVEGLKYTYTDYLEDLILKKEIKKEYCKCNKSIPNYPEMVWCEKCGNYMREK